MYAKKINNEWQLFNRLPASWNNSMPYNWKEIGIKEVVQPIITASQKKGELIYDSDNDVCTYEVLDKTAEELENDLNNKVIDYRKRIYDTTEKLMLSAKARALGKGGENLTESQLGGLVIAYTEKKDVATQIIQDQTPTNTSIVDLINFEVTNDFTSTSLDQTIAYLNATYNAGIPTDVSDLKKYCYLIITKFTLGEKLRQELASLCEYFRSKLITNLDKQEFAKIDARLLIPAQITNDSTVAEIMTLKTAFDNV